MSTENTPAPGTPEWLRREADGIDTAQRQQGGLTVVHHPIILEAGLRAAAERIEQLEGTLRDFIEAVPAINSLRASNDRLRAELVLLRDEKANLHASVANYIRKCAELSDENVELKRVLLQKTQPFVWPEKDHNP